jgi:hypothetical protein
MKGHAHMCKMSRRSEVHERKRKYWKKKREREREKKERGKGMVYLTIP